LHPPSWTGAPGAEDEHGDPITQLREHVGRHAHLDFELSLKQALIGTRAARYSIIDRPTRLERRPGGGRHRYSKVERCP
jgi:hypothetical protein